MDVETTEKEKEHSYAYKAMEICRERTNNSWALGDRCSTYVSGLNRLRAVNNE